MRKFLRLETLEDRLTPAGFFLTGVGGLTNPATPNVRVYDASPVPGGSSTYLNPPGDLAAFGPTFAGSVRVANGDVNGDGIDDIITAQGPGAGSASQVKIYDGRSALVGGVSIEIASFYAYSNEAGASQTPGFAGGVFVASADFNGDGFDEVVVSAGAGGRGHVKVFNFHGGDPAAPFLGSAPELRSSFYAYTDFAGEIRITTLRDAGIEYLVTASGKGTSQSDVRSYRNVYDLGQVPDLTFVAPASQTFPFAGYFGGLSVAAGDTDGDGNEELFVSKNSGPSLVSVYGLGQLNTPRFQFEAFPGYNGEVRLGAADVDGDGKVEVLTSTGDSPGAGGAHVKVWNVGTGPSELRSFFAYPGYANGVFLSTNDFTTTQTFSNSTPLAIPQTDTPVSSSIAVDLLTLNDSTIRPKAIQIDLNITATSGSFNGDLTATLRSATAGPFELFSNVNSVGAGFGITLADTAATNIASAGATIGVRLTGIFRPELGNLLAEFGNSALAGTWTLSLRDSGTTSDAYRLDSWAIRMVY